MEETEEKKEKKKTIILIIVLSIIIISVIAILGYGKYVETKPEEIQKISVEEMISEYEGEETTGEDVKLLLAKLLTDELEKSSITLTKIEYDIKIISENCKGYIDILQDKKNENIQQIIDLRNKIVKEDTYVVKYQKDGNTIISISIKTKNS